MRSAPAPLWAVLTLLVGGCGGEEPWSGGDDPDRVEGAWQAAEARPRPGADPAPNRSMERPADVGPAELRHVPADTVVGWTGPGGRPFEVARRTSADASHLHARIGTRTFPLPVRTAGLTLTQAPCASCHEGVTVRADRATEAHAEIRPVHPAGAGTDCAACHRPERVETLRVRGGDDVTLDHAYRLCAECHFQQVNDWAAGAHGKRLAGWRGRRVVMSCADCHDPHRPAMERRIPYPGPRIYQPGEGER